MYTRKPRRPGLFFATAATISFQGGFKSVETIVERVFSIRRSPLRGYYGSTPALLRGHGIRSERANSRDSHRRCYGHAWAGHPIVCLVLCCEWGESATTDVEDCLKRKLRALRSSFARWRHFVPTQFMMFDDKVPSFHRSVIVPTKAIAVLFHTYCTH